MVSYQESYFDKMFEQLMSCRNLTGSYIRSLENLSFESEQKNKFSKPMMWIGFYIAVASLFCILPMVVDLFHGLKNRKLWFPCKYFTLNAASLSVIAVAMKLPVDLNNAMPFDVDQAAKLGSLAFLCTIMANLLPSLASMNNKELVTNIIALGVLVITVVVNICIQIKTGVVSNSKMDPNSLGYYFSILTYYNRFLAITYVALLLMLLIIYASSALSIFKTKQILESKYQTGRERALKDLELQQPRRLTTEKLKRHVKNHWIMAETGSPQFMATCSATTSASGVICVASTVIHIVIMVYTRPYMKYYGSDYKWSVSVILVTQFIGVLVGSIAPLSRCFASLSFQVSIKWIRNHIRVFKVESYCTQKLSDMKQSKLPFSPMSRRCKIVIQDLKVVILNSCIGLQKTVMVACKITTVITIVFVICVFYSWKWLNSLFSVFGIVLVQKPEQFQENEDLSQYVLKLEDDMELAERTLIGISRSMNRLIQEAEMQQPKNLMKFLNKSKGFEGVGKYDIHQIPSLPTKEYVDCWSLPIVTLTTIAISLPDILENVVDRLLSSVSEGLTYVTLVEENLNASDDYVSIRKAAKMLWLEVEVYHKWLGNKLQNHAAQVNTTEQILEWFTHTAQNIVNEMENTRIRGSNDDSICISISANSMYRITQSILFFYQDNIDQVSQEELFVQLSSMIADILAACLTNLPRVIAMKCNESAIEKREESVHVAARLLGETMQILNIFQERQLPSLNPDELAFIDKWHDYIKHPFP